MFHRIRILRVLRRFVTSRKDTYMVVLPDAVPFITEALEDDEQVGLHSYIKLIGWPPVCLFVSLSNHFYG